MRKIFALAVLIAFVVPAAGAEELQLGVNTSMEFDNNVFNAQENSISDIAIRVGPILGLRRNQGNFVYDLRYRPRWETFVDGSAEDNWDHNAFGRATWQLTPRTSIEATDRFVITNSLNRAGFITDPGAPDATPVTDVEVARQQITRNMASLGLTHTFTPRVSSTANVSYSLFRTDREDRFESDTVTTDLRGSYLLTAKDTVGGGAGFTYQNFTETETQPGRETVFYRLFATWFHTFDPSFTLRVQAGPTFIDSDQTTSAPISAVVPAFPFRDTESGGLRFIDASTCPTTDDGQPYEADRCGLFSTELTGAAASSARSLRFNALQADEQPDAALVPTIFATIELQKRWEHFRALASFNRTDSSSSGVGQSTVLNFLSGSVLWEPTSRWRMGVSGSWALRQGATDQTANAIGFGTPGSFAFPPVLAPGTVVATASPAANLRLVQSDNFVDVTTYTARMSVTRFLGKQSSVFVRYIYVNQSFDGTTTRRDFDNHRVTVGFRLILDWIRL